MQSFQTLPVGYYPNEIGASEYKLKADEGMSYAHHLFIEQSVKHTKEGGYLFFLVPNFILKVTRHQNYMHLLKKHALFKGYYSFLFPCLKTRKMQKVYLFSKKKGANVTMPKQALLVELPKFSNMKAMEDIMDQLNTWFATHK